MKFLAHCFIQSIFHLPMRGGNSAGNSNSSNSGGLAAINPPRRVKREKQIHGADLTAIACVVNAEHQPI